MGGERFEKEAGELKPWGGDGGDRDLREGEEETDPPVVCCAAPGRRRRADSDFDLRAPAVLLCEGLFRRWKWVGLIYGPKWACNMSPWIPECFFFPLTVLMCAIWSAWRKAIHVSTHTSLRFESPKRAEGGHVSFDGSRVCRDSPSDTWSPTVLVLARALHPCVHSLRLTRSASRCFLVFLLRGDVF